MTWSSLRKMSGCIINCPCPLFWRKSRAAMHFRICWATKNSSGGAFKFRAAFVSSIWRILWIGTALSCRMWWPCNRPTKCSPRRMQPLNWDRSCVSIQELCLAVGGVRESSAAHLLLSLTCFWICNHCYYTAAGLKTGTVIQSLSDWPFPSLCLALMIFGF